MFKIDQFVFNKDTPARVRELSHNQKKVGENWPIVYVINNNREAYVGETVSAYKRVQQHLDNPSRIKLNEIRIISDEEFNKSVVLDLESFLIKHMSSDKKYVLQNGNGGLQNHDYYDKERYEKEFKRIWDRLRRLGIAENTISDIENSEMFKYSPYKTLGDEQREAEYRIIEALGEYGYNGNRATILVKGGAGTGKTILAVYLMKLLADISNKKLEIDDEDYDVSVEEVFASERLSYISKFGIVIPQSSLKTSLKDVFKHVDGLDPNMVLTPNEVVKNYIKSGEKYDLLIVDEAHRLKSREHGKLAVSMYGIFNRCNKFLGMQKDKGSELDWILKCSDNQVFFRDELQTVRPCDVYAEEFQEKIATTDDKSTVVEVALETQWRCEGGNDYINYIKDIISCRNTEKRTFDTYDFKLYKDVNQMVNDIKSRNSEIDLCRTVAGYAWPWNTKDDPNGFDIEINGNKYRWNSKGSSWILSENAINEIGCIHTVQGYDLNYVGVIIGKDLRYSAEDNLIYADKSNYYDQLGKSGVAFDREALTEYIQNIYLTLMTRGIKGTYIYVCDDALREYFEKYVEVIK